VRLRLLDRVVPLKGRIHGINVPEFLNQPTDGRSREMREGLQQTKLRVLYFKDVLHPVIVSIGLGLRMRGDGSMS